MGGTLEKKNFEKNLDEQEISHNGLNKNGINKNPQDEYESTKSLIKEKKENKSLHKRNGASKKKKNGKVSITAKDKDVNYEKKVLELIHEKNAEKEDYDLIYDIISKHFFYKH